MIAAVQAAPEHMEINLRKYLRIYNNKQSKLYLEASESYRSSSRAMHDHKNRE
jgi:hypothetical protein